jgi:hypothetical protein
LSRPNYIQVYLSDQEKKEFSAMARELGISESEFLRESGRMRILLHRKEQEPQEDYLYGAWHFGREHYRGMVIDSGSRCLFLSELCKDPKEAANLAVKWIKEKKLTGVMRMV